MSEGNRVWATLLGVTLLIGAVFSIGLWAGATYNYYGNPYSEGYQRAYSAPDKQAPRDSAARRQSRYFKDICENPQSEDDANLCQQWRSANGARDSAAYALIFGGLQTVVGILGLCGLFATIYFAWKAWGETKRAADAALRANSLNARTAAAAADAVGHAYQANRISERALAIDQRPWVTVKASKPVTYRSLVDDEVRCTIRSYIFTYDKLIGDAVPLEDTPTTWLTEMPGGVFIS